MSIRTLIASTVALGASVGGVVGLASASFSAPTSQVAVPVAQVAVERHVNEYSRSEPRVAPAVAAAAQASLTKRQSAMTSTAHAIAQKGAAIKKAEAAKKAAEAAKKAAEAKFIAANGFSPSLKDPKEIARAMSKHKYGWSDADFECYNNIIMRESLWDPYADNPTSSAYGIPQALPGKRMAEYGADWKTNPVTQIKWGLNYIEERYGSACSAWSFKRAHGWY